MKPTPDQLLDAGTKETVYFSGERCNRRISLSKDNTTAELKRKSNWCSVVLREAIQPNSGVYTLKFKVKHVSPQQRICVGFVDASDSTQLVGMGAYAVGWCLNGDLYSYGFGTKSNYGTVETDFNGKVSSSFAHFS